LVPTPGVLRGQGQVLAEIPGRRSWLALFALALDVQIEVIVVDSIALLVHHGLALLVEPGPRGELHIEPLAALLQNTASHLACAGEVSLVIDIAKRDVEKRQGLAERSLP
jgi:hypothetical protein